MTRISAELRRRVAMDADYLCEYCLIHESDTFFGCEVDHIISVKHGGPTEESNLAYACLFCNRNKGSDIASVVPGSASLVRFYRPRLDAWSEHFRLGDNGVIISITDIGEATARILGFNHIERLLERSALQAAGRYPSSAARSRMQGF